MPLNIKNPEAEQLAQSLAKRTGETITQAVIAALRERLSREQREDGTIEKLVEEVMAIGKHCAALPLLDARSADEIIGYDEYGLP
jgi:antitoxin VapB